MESNELLEYMTGNRKDDSGHPGFSLADIRNYRDKYMAKTASSVERMIIFDTLFKIIVGAAYILFLFIGDHGPAGILTTLLIIILLVIFAWRNVSLRNQQRQIDESLDVMTVLKMKSNLFKRIYGEFFVSSALTSLLFVLAGFRVYMFVKYGQDLLWSLLSDPVTYLFLAASFIIPFVAQRLTFSREMGELNSIIETEQDEVTGGIRVNRIKRNRRIRQMVFIILIVTGAALLIYFWLRH